MKRPKIDLSFYLVLDPTTVKFETCDQVLEDAIRAGVSTIQLREKDCSNEDFERLAQKMSQILKSRKIPFIINDRLDIAKKINADGVHIGQSDVDWREARRVLGEDATVGLSVETFTQAQLAELADVDYLGVSSVFPTATKKDARNFWGLDGLKQLDAYSKHPLVAIGGIDLSNAQEVLESGADGLAVVSLICSAENPLEEALKMKKMIDTFKRKQK